MSKTISTTALDLSTVTAELQAAWDEYVTADGTATDLMVVVGSKVSAFVTAGGKQSKVASLIGKSEGYVSKLRNIGDTVAKFPTLNDDERRNVARTATGNDGGGDLKAMRAATTVAQVRKAVKPVSGKSGKSGGKSIAERLDAIRVELEGKAGGKDADTVTLDAETMAAVQRFTEWAGPIGEMWAAQVA